MVVRVVILYFISFNPVRQRILSLLMWQHICIAEMLEPSQKGSKGSAHYKQCYVRASLADSTSVQEEHIIK